MSQIPPNTNNLGLAAAMIAGPTSGQVISMGAAGKAGWNDITQMVVSASKISIKGDLLGIPLSLGPLLPSYALPACILARVHNSKPQGLTMGLWVLCMHVAHGDADAAQQIFEDMVLAEKMVSRLEIAEA